jgi:hypothetical protein
MKKIIVYSGKMNDAGFEQMTVCLENSVMTLVREDLTPSQKSTYDEFVALIGNGSFKVLEDSPYLIDIDRVTSSEIVQNASTLSYSQLTLIEKEKIEAFNQVLTNL